MIEKQYKAVFLDWDDTIGDWNRSARMAQHDLYEQFHLSEWFASYDDWYDAYHEHNTVLWDLYGHGLITKAFLKRDRCLYPVLHQLGFIEGEKEWRELLDKGQTMKAPQALVDLADRMGKTFLELTNRYFQLLPEAEEVVKYLAAKYPLSIISNGFQEVQHYKLEHSGLLPYITHILISEEVGINKPMPGIYQEALKRNGVGAEQAIMIGDSISSDISGAHAAGIDQIWIAPANTMAPTDMQPTFTVTKLTDIMSIL